MSRKKIELNLVASKFRYYTEDIRLEIPRIVKKYRCGDVSDTVIDGLWIACRDDLYSIIINNGIEDFSMADNTVDRLSVEMRETIRNYIDQALAYEGELGDLNNDAFEQTYRANFAPITQQEREYRAQRAQHNDR